MYLVPSLVAPTCSPSILPDLLLIRSNLSEDAGKFRNNLHVSLAEMAPGHEVHRTRVSRYASTKGGCALQ